MTDLAPDSHNTSQQKLEQAFRSFLQKHAPVPFSIFAIGYWGMVLIGLIQSYTPVPVWDMWDGYLDFYVIASSGKSSIWWAQHNEHRLLLTRLFIWIDMTVFNGSFKFLYLVNFLLCTLIVLFFWRTLKKINVQENSYLGSFLLVWLSFWAQYENFTNPFQTHFFLVLLLPALAFHLLYISIEDKGKSSLAFSGACALGVLSLGTMANGMIVLPLLLLLGLLYRIDRHKILILVMFNGLSLYLYLHEYFTPPGHPSITLTLSEKPLELIVFPFMYMGNPFFYLSSPFFGESIGRFTSAIAGVILFLFSAVIAYRVLVKGKQEKNRLQLSLLIFILFILVTAGVTGAGRVMFGFNQTTTSRYTTGVILAWAAAGILAAINYRDFIMSKKVWVWGGLLAITLLMLPLQLNALEKPSQLIFDKLVAALAIELGIPDEELFIETYTYPSAERVLQISETPIQKNLTIFGHPLIRDLREQIGTQFPIPENESVDCVGNLMSVMTVDPKSSTYRIEGWIDHPNMPETPSILWLLDLERNVTGFALRGNQPSAKATDPDQIEDNAGYKGYLKSITIDKRILLFEPVSGCSIEIQIP